MGHEKAEKNMMDVKNSDVVATYANIDAVGFKPSTPQNMGLKNLAWFKVYYKFS